jgi:hypothetical protein
MHGRPANTFPTLKPGWFDEILPDDLVREKLIRLAAREAVQNPNTMKVTLAASSLQGTLQ